MNKIEAMILCLSLLCSSCSESIKRDDEVNPEVMSAITAINKSEPVSDAERFAFREANRRSIPKPVKPPKFDQEEASKIILATQLETLYQNSVDSANLNQKLNVLSQQIHPITEFNMRMHLGSTSTISNKILQSENAVLNSTLNMHDELASSLHTMHDDIHADINSAIWNQRIISFASFVVGAIMYYWKFVRPLKAEILELKNNIADNQNIWKTNFVTSEQSIADRDALYLQNIQHTNDYLTQLISKINHDSNQFTTTLQDLKDSNIESQLAVKKNYKDLKFSMDTLSSLITNDNSKIIGTLQTLQEDLELPSPPPKKSITMTTPYSPTGSIKITSLKGKKSKDLSATTTIFRKKVPLTFPKSAKILIGSSDSYFQSLDSSSNEEKLDKKTTKI